MSIIISIFVAIGMGMSFLLVLFMGRRNKIAYTLCVPIILGCLFYTGDRIVPMSTVLTIVGYLTWVFTSGTVLWVTYHAYHEEKDRVIKKIIRGFFIVSAVGLGTPLYLQGIKLISGV